MVRSLSVLLLAAGLQLSSMGQGPLRFDMGKAGSPTASGWTHVTAAHIYTPAAGFGWVQAPNRAFFRPPPSAGQETHLPLNMVRDGQSGASDLVFRIDVPNGAYQVMAYVGDLGDPQGLLAPAAVTPRERLDVIVGGTTVIEDAHARTVVGKASFNGAQGGFKRVRLRTSVTQGFLQITFHCDGLDPSLNSVLGIEVHSDQPDPIRFDHGTRTLVADPLYAAVLAPGLAAFNAHDYAGARAAFDQVSDPLARAWGYALLLGWITGAEDDVDDQFLTQTKMLLQSSTTPDDIRVAGLLAELIDFESADLFNRARGYTAQVFPGSLGGILLNLNAASQLFEQMDDDILRAAEPHRPESPLFAKAAWLIARNYYSRNTKIGDPTTPYNQDWIPLLAQEFGANLDLFPKAANLRVFTFMAQGYAMAGGLVLNWQGPSALPGFDPAATWWATFTEYPLVAAAPGWAQHQRAYHRAYRDAGKWWMLGRLLQGELGGGGGDDVEGGALLALPAIVRSEPGGVLEDGAREALEKVLFGPEVNQSQGYFANCGDSEHAAEFTTNPLFVLLPSQYGNPQHLELATRTIRNLDDTQDPVPWTQVVGPGQRHFKSYIFGANSVCGPARDIPMNMRAAIPGFFLKDYNGSPRTRQLFEELARAWAQNALSTAQGKPQGIFPAAVSLGNPPVFGTGGNWWMNGGYYDLPNGANIHGYLYNLMLSAYETSTAPDRWTFLDVVWKGVQLVDGWVAGTVTGTAPGSAGWAANLFKKDIAVAAANAKASLLADPNLAIPPSGETAINRVVGMFAGPYEKYMNQSPTVTKNKAAITNTFETARTWLRWFWPLATSSVSYTDRIYVASQGSHALLYATMQGGSFSVAPTHAVSWSNPNTAAGELDFAALVNDVQTDSIKILMFNFDSGPRDFGLRVWRRLSLGDYDVRIGNDANHDDFMDGAPHTTFSYTLDTKGATVVLPQVPAGTLQVVELVRTQPLPSGPVLKPDAAMSLEDVVVAGDGTVDVTVHNLGSADVIGASLELREGGTLLASLTLPTIAAPLDLTPRSFTTRICYSPIGPGAPLSVVVVPAPGTTEITLVNNQVDLLPQIPDPVITQTPVQPSGSFTIEIDSPYDKNELYGLAVGITGSSPGWLVAPGLVVPVNPDPVTFLALDPANPWVAVPIGTLDAQGHTSIIITPPTDPSLAGIVVSFGAAVADPTLVIRAVSNGLTYTL